MLLGLTFVLVGILVLSLVFQEKLKVPFPITMVGAVMILAAFNIDVIDIESEMFDQLLYMILPTLLMVDILHLKPKLLKENWRSIFATAGFGVAIAIGAGLLFQDWILPGYEIEAAAMIALMTMVTATDPVTVAAVFANYKMPERLKFLVESESLHNDGTAFVIFSIAIAFLSVPMGAVEVAQKASMVLGGAVAIGFVAGAIGTYLLKLSNEPMTEAFIILSVATGAFWAAEQFHFAGIFAVVVAGILMNTLIHLKGEQMETNIKTVESELEEGKSPILGVNRKLKSLEHLTATYENHKQIVNYIAFVALVANTVLFASMAGLIDINLLKEYWKEIVAVFIATTVIRAGVMGIFAVTSNATKKMQDISVDWWAVMTSAGVKGGLSILMLHMFPSDYVHYDLFEAIVVGNILLSTVVYSIILTLVIMVRKEKLWGKAA